MDAIQEPFGHLAPSWIIELESQCSNVGCLPYWLKWNEQRESNGIYTTYSFWL